MAEYDSFHYLMHKVDDGVAPTFVGAKMASFDELYSPREETIRLLWSIEEHYWRTRCRVQFKCYEMRSKQIMILTCVNTETNEDYRTIILKLDALYKIIEDKAADRKENEVLKFKKEKKLKTDDELASAVKEYVKARLQMKKQPQPWPVFATTVDTEGVGEGGIGNHVKESTTNSEAITTDEAVAPVVAMATAGVGGENDSNSDYKEMMITFEKLHEDMVDIEIAPPLDLTTWCAGLEIAKELKLGPMVAPPTVSSTSTDTAEEVTVAVEVKASNNAGHDSASISPNTINTTVEINISTPIMGEGNASPAAGNAKNAAKMLKQQNSPATNKTNTTTTTTTTTTGNNNNNIKGKANGTTATKGMVKGKK